MIKKFKPITPSLRHRKILKSIPRYPSLPCIPSSYPIILSDTIIEKGKSSKNGGSLSNKEAKNKGDVQFPFKERKAGGSLKKLIKGIKKTSGRNNQGKITSYRKGGGHKRSYRLVDYKHTTAAHSLSEVIRIEYNPNSSSNIVLLRNNESYFYRLAPENIKIGDSIGGIYNNSDHLKTGEVRFIGDIPIGTSICSLNLYNKLPSNHYTSQLRYHYTDRAVGQCGQIARAAGTSCKIIKKMNDSFTLVSFPTRQIKEIHNKSTAIIGQCSNPEHINTSLGKAGASRWLGIRPKTRGEAMNPVDHPHGGKSHGSGGKGNKQKNRWGKLAKSKK